MNHNFDQFDCNFQELDGRKKVYEIIDVVKALKREKSPGSDNLLNEYFIESIDISSSHICDILMLF